jgi:hypothetical protein
MSTRVMARVSLPIEQVDGGLGPLGNAEGGRHLLEHIISYHPETSELLLVGQRHYVESISIDPMCFDHDLVYVQRAVR